MTKPQCVIFDIDGTLADNAHRQWLVEGSKKNWDAFYDACHLDTPHEHVRLLARMLNEFARYYVLVVTGRPERVRDTTEEWLMTNDVEFYHELFMRPDGDSRPDDVLKEEILDKYILPEYTPVMVFDDRTKVVSMWRRRGIPCLQVAPGDF